MDLKGKFTIVQEKESHVKGREFSQISSRGLESVRGGLHIVKKCSK